MAMKGGKELLLNLRTEVKKIEKGSLKGVRAAALYVQGESMRVVPQETGTLINSAFSEAYMNGTVPTGTVGYTAEYAPFVHEMPSSYNYSKPGTGPKFLEKPLKNSKAQILKIIGDRSKV